MRTLLFGVVLTLAAPTWAEPAALLEANRLLAEGEFERALKKLDGALKRSSTAGELAALHVARGKCLLALSRRDQALAAFTAALEQDASSEAGDDASPDALALFAEARRAFPGKVTITVDAPASVQIDGRDLGPAPLATALPAGEHVIDVTALDGRRATRTVRVDAGRAVEVAVALPPSSLAATPGKVSTDVARRTSTPGDPAVSASPPAPTRSSIGWVPLGAGVAVAVAGGVCLWQARVQYDRIADPAAPALTPEELRRASATGSTLQPLGWVGVGVGAAAIATGAVLLALPSSTPAPQRPVVVGGLAPDGSAWLGVSGGLP